MAKKRQQSTDSRLSKSETRSDDLYIPEVSLDMGGFSLDGGTIDLSDDATDDAPSRPFEEDAAEIIQELADERKPKDKFAASRQSEHETMEDVMDGEFFFSVVFQSVKQRNEFLRATGLVGYIEDGQFIDGLRLAEAMGVPITHPTPKPITRRSDKRLLALARDGFHPVDPKRG